MSNERADYPVDARATQSCVGGILRWSVAWMENSVPVVEDGVGLAPRAVRLLLLSQEEEWSVHVLAEYRAMKVAKILRQKLGLSIAESAAAIKRLPGEVFVGTRVEAQWLTEALAAAGMAVTVTRLRP